MSVNDKGFPSFYFDDFFAKLPDLAGKTIAITGTTTGTGYIAARSCLKKGAEVIVLNRDSKRSQESLQNLERAVPGCKVSQISCDLQSFASVRQAAKELNEKCAAQGLDVLSLNAGIMAFPNQATVDGFDVQMQTNQTSHFLLVKDVFPLLKMAAERTGEARIATHSSLKRHGGPLEAKYFGKSGPELGSDGGLGPLERYHQSKLANAVFAHALATKLAAAGLSNIKVASCAPGFAATSLLDSSSQLPGYVLKLVPTCFLTFYQQSSEDGCMPLLTAMLDPEVKSRDFYLPAKGTLCFKGEWRGEVVVLREPLPPAEKVVADPTAQEVLWKGCEEAIGEKFVIA